jgi:hypothetical protein
MSLLFLSQTPISFKQNLRRRLLSRVMPTIVLIARLESLFLYAGQEIPQAGHLFPPTIASRRCLDAQGGGRRMVKELRMLGVVADQVAILAPHVLVYLQCVQELPIVNTVELQIVGGGEIRVNLPLAGPSR